MTTELILSIDNGKTLYNHSVTLLDSDPKQCSEQQLAALLDGVLLLLEQAKAAANFTYMQYKVDNEAYDPYYVYNCIEQAATYESLHAKMLEYANKTYNASRQDRYWDDSEHQAGTEGVKPLACRDKKYIIHYIEFLYTNDLDHEVAQCGDIADIIRAHEWCPESLRLMVARATSCCGQHGYDDFYDNYTDTAPTGIAVQGLKNYLINNIDVFFQALRDENFTDYLDEDNNFLGSESFSNKWLQAVYQDLNASDQERLIAMIESS